MGGYGKGRFIDLDVRDLSGTTEYVSGAGMLAYAASETIRVVLSASMSRQMRDDPIMMDRFGIGRRMVMLSVSGRFPSHQGSLLEDADDSRVHGEDEAVMDDRGSVDTIEER